MDTASLISSTTAIFNTSIERVTDNGWYRISATFTTDRNGKSSTSVEFLSPAIGDQALIWGLQLVHDDKQLVYERTGANRSIISNSSPDIFTYNLNNHTDKFEIVGNELKVIEGSILDASLQSLYNLDISSTDSTGNSYSEIFPVYIREPDTRLVFEGVTKNHIDVGDTPFDFTNAFTISTTIELSEYPSKSSGLLPIIFNKESSYELGVYTDGEIKYALNPDGGGWVWIETGYKIPVGIKVNLSFVYDGDNAQVKLFADGNLVYDSSFDGSLAVFEIYPTSVGDRVIPSSLAQNNNTLWFGARLSSGSGNPIAAKFSDIQIYNTVLSTNEVRTIVSGAELSSGLIARYDFSSTQPLKDKSGNGNDAIINNAGYIGY